MMDPMNRAIFLDVDGTFVNERGVVPASARSAVISARANGHPALKAVADGLTGTPDEDGIATGFAELGLI